MSWLLRGVVMLLVTTGVAACERGMHDMYDQPRYRQGSASALFDDGNAARRAPSGSVARGSGPYAMSSSGQQLQAADDRPPAVTMALLQRGRERYDIYCAACHGLGGEGDGIVVQRGFPAPPTYHQDRLRQAPDSHFAEVIAHGYGVMYPYGDRVAPADRWAIVAYIRALQLSRHAPVEHLPARDRAALSEGGMR